MSSLLSADDLNDFIRPSVACIKPTTNTNTNSNSSHMELEYEIDPQGEVTQIRPNTNSSDLANGAATAPKKLEKAQISLADCLACSGCITSSEEVLVAQHSHKEFLKFLQEHQGEDITYVLSVSQQARASLAHAYSTSIEVMDMVLGKVFTKYGVKYAVSVNAGREVARSGIWKEVEKRRSGSGLGNEEIMMNLSGDGGNETKGAGTGPLLTGICPGWVLFVEKTHPETLPYLSIVASPQFLTCQAVKKLLPGTVYNLSLMPCFDKKLEASRDADVVDCVITPKEFVVMTEEDGIDVSALVAEQEQEEMDKEDYVSWTRSVVPPGWPDYDGLCGWGGDSTVIDGDGREGGESGGYALSYAIECLRRLGEGHTIRRVSGRNSDVYEIQVVKNTGQVIRRAGIVNGFKNIQNLVRKLKDEKDGKKVVKKRGLRVRRSGDNSNGEGNGGPVSALMAEPSTCDVVEVMACPGGCVNGGGQIASVSAPATSVSTDSEWIESVRRSYWSAPALTSSMDIDKVSWAAPLGVVAGRERAAVPPPPVQPGEELFIGATW